MGLFHRRFPVYGRRLPFWAGTAALLVGLLFGLGWNWNWSLQTGNVFLLLLVPRTVVPTAGWRVFGLALAIAGLFLLLRHGVMREGTVRQRARDGRALPTFRFYPLLFLLGLFLTHFGAVFLFDASVYGDATPAGYAAFVYLDYSGLLDRPVVTCIGLLVLAVGLVCTRRAFARGLGWAPPTAPRATVDVHTSSVETPAPIAGPLAFAPRTARAVLSTAPTAPVAPAAGVTARTPPGVRARSLLDEDLE
jgi:hypothetical protein